MKNVDFTHLHIHNEFSQLDGYGTADAYVAKAKLLGFKYLGLTNHGNMDGIIKFQQSCESQGITPILGCEGYVVPKLESDKKKKTRRAGHVLLLIKNEIGFQNLCKLLTFANLEGFYYRPRFTYEALLQNCKGLIVSTACPQSFTRMDGGIKLFAALCEALPDDVYCEVMPHDTPMQIETNKLKLKLARKYGVKIIASNDCHYINIGDYLAQDILLAMQRKTTWNNPKRWHFDVRGLHLRTAKEMVRAFKKQGFYKRRYLLNTIEVAEKCSDFRIPKMDIKLPRVKGIPIRQNKYLWDLCHKRLAEVEPDGVAYRTRAMKEYDLIVKKNFTKYFLIVWELINWCRENRILVGPGRGSVGGSLIAYLLGITAVDPMKHKLIFERFITEDRIDYPDIDVDFEHTKRHLVKQHLEEMYGENNIAGVSSFNRMKARAVIRDVSRVFEVPYGEVDRFAKLIEDNDENTGIQDAIDEYDEGQEFAEAYPLVVKMAKKLEGQVKGYSQHAAALVVSRESIGDCGRCNLLERDGITIVNWEKEDTEYVGLMKLDALGLKLLSILGEAKRLIWENHKKNIKLESINLDDKKVLKDINAGHTVGLFQLNAWATTALIKEMGIEKFDHIVAAVALVRPGPSNSGMTAEYIRRKNGKLWKGHEQYVAITSDTYGILVYQEQVMDVINKIAGLPYSTADYIRKIIGKKRDRKEFEKYRQTFLDGCTQVGVFSRHEAKQFWKGLQEWAKYGFNKSHSVEYAMLGYWCAWLKKYFPTEFVCASLTYGAAEKKSEIVEEAYRLGLTLILPKVGMSSPDRWVAKDNKLFVPFIEVKGIGKVKAVDAAQSPSNKGIKRFYSKEDDTIVKHKGKFGELLDEIGAYDPSEQTEITEDMKSYFDFRIVTNPRDNYPRLYKLFGDKIRLTDLDAVLQGDYNQLAKLASKKRLTRKHFFQGHRRLMACTKCELRQECTAPVPPSPGTYNIFITGEAPGFDEDNEGEGFVGASGRLVWKYLRARKYFRPSFHVTNINKCYPAESKKPNADQIKTCSRFIHKELRQVKPILILAYGNTSLNYFTGRKSGIIAMSGRTTWDEKYGAWIAWSVHPAAMLHNPDNEQYYKAGMKNFVKLLRSIAPNIKGER
jgi:DNA polymerase-3 subunit alpha